MLHRISLPYQPEELAGIFALQLELLRVACSVTKIDRAAVENTFSDVRIVDWITATYARSVGPLNQFASQCSLSVK